MLFAFLLSNKELLNNLNLLKVKSSRLHLLPGLLIAAVFLFVLISVILSSDFDNSGWLRKAKAVNTISPSDNMTHNIGINLMTKYLLPFEVVSVFLMMALIGAAHMARKEPKA
jgi:NADH-quinone oxidoreductase subunit J